MNKKTIALETAEYRSIIEAAQQGFTYEDETGKTHKFRANQQLSVILQLEAACGLRIGDILGMRISDIVKDGGRHRLNIREQKTGKIRTYTVPEAVFSFICSWAFQNGKSKNDKLFSITPRAIQKQLQIVCSHLGLEGVSTHSFRKTFATEAYRSSDYNIELVRQLLQHSSTVTTQRYIGISRKEIEGALQNASDVYLLG